MDKPLKDWTLGEVQEYCDEHECGFCELFQNRDCLLNSSPNKWNLSKKPRWTQQEVSLATVLMEFRRTDTTTIGKQVNGPLWWRAQSGEHGILPNELFPSILPGQSYTLDEIIGGAQ